jgi:Ca2+-binding RTX toxin-like protein
VAVYGSVQANYVVTNLGGGVYTVVGATTSEGADTLSGIERLRFSDGAFLDLDVPPLVTAGADSVLGTGGNESIAALGGADTVDGAGGADSLSGGTGNDILLGGSGDDRLSGNTGVDFLSGGDGADSLFGGTGADTLRGEEGNDRLGGGDGADLMEGGAGDDSLAGGADNDTLSGGAGTDTLMGGLGADHFLFEQPAGAFDLVVGFVLGTDKIALLGSAFGLSAGGLDEAHFEANLSGFATAGGAPMLVHETDAGRLWFDADGADAGFDRVQIARLWGKPLISEADIVIV